MAIFISYSISNVANEYWNLTGTERPMQPQPQPRRRPPPPTAHVRRPDAWDPPDPPPVSASITSACTLATDLGPAWHMLTQACRDKCDIASETAGATRHHANRLVLCMEHAHAAARALRGGCAGVLSMSMSHAGSLRSADMAPRRGDLASIAPATRCLPACADGPRDTQYTTLFCQLGRSHLP
jgi:hypothetical protein